MDDEKIYPVVERYNALSVEERVKGDNTAKFFAEIKGDYPKWEDRKNIQAALSLGILKRMVVQLMAKAATSVEELDWTLGLCDKYNPGPAVFIEKRKKELLNSTV